LVQQGFVLLGRPATIQPAAQAEASKDQKAGRPEG
jgi:hypothetical protein